MRQVGWLWCAISPGSSACLQVQKQWNFGLKPPKLEDKIRLPPFATGSEHCVMRYTCRYRCRVPTCVPSLRATRLQSNEPTGSVALCAHAHHLPTNNNRTLWQWLVPALGRGSGQTCSSICWQKAGKGPKDWRDRRIQRWDWRGPTGQARHKTNRHSNGL